MNYRKCPVPGDDHRGFELCDRGRGIVDHEALAVARRAQCDAGRIGRRIARDDSDVIRAVGQGRGVPGIEFLIEFIFQKLPLCFVFAAIKNAEAQLVVVVVVRAPQNGLVDSLRESLRWLLKFLR